MLCIVSPPKVDTRARVNRISRSVCASLTLARTSKYALRNPEASWKRFEFSWRSLVTSKTILQENAAARIQAHQRMRQERNTLLEIRVQRGRSLAAALYNAKDKDDEKKKHNHVHGHHHHGHSHYGHGANSVFDASASFLRKTGASTRRVGGGHVVVASARDGARKPAMDRKGARHRN